MTDFAKLYADEAHKKKVLLEVLSERDAEIELLRAVLWNVRPYVYGLDRIKAIDAVLTGTAVQPDAKS